MEDSYKFYENTGCEYFPCHENGLENFSCLFCYCPLYHLEDCGGDYKILDNGTKDCTNCLIPHIPDNYDYMTDKIWGDED